MVKTFSGISKEAASLKRGDVVIGFNGHAAVVRCVVRSPCPLDSQMLQLPGDLVITPWHPVHAGGIWQFPCKVIKKIQYFLKNMKIKIKNKS